MRMCNNLHVDATMHRLSCAHLVQVVPCFGNLCSGLVECYPLFPGKFIACQIFQCQKSLVVVFDRLIPQSQAEGRWCCLSNACDSGEALAE